MPTPKVVIVDRLGPVLLGTMLSGGGMLHLWFHSVWGTEDWGVVVIIVAGAGVMFNREIVALIRAWRGKVVTEEQRTPDE